MAFHVIGVAASHSVWVRGLKQLIQTQQENAALVALRVGAWIETGQIVKGVKAYIVALRVGAWIETRFSETI